MDDFRGHEIRPKKEIHQKSRKTRGTSMAGLRSKRLRVGRATSLMAVTFDSQKDRESYQETLDVLVSSEAGRNALAWAGGQGKPRIEEQLRMAQILDYRRSSGVLDGVPGPKMRRRGIPKTKVDYLRSSLRTWLITGCLIRTADMSCRFPPPG